MRRSLFVLCVITSSLATQASAQFGSGSGGGRPSGPPAGTFGAPAKPVVPPEDLRPIELEITILDIAGAETAKTKLTDEQQLNRLERLEAEGKVAGVQRMKLNLVSNVPSQLQQGETVQITVGRTRSPGSPDPASRGGFGGMSEVTRAQNVGTLVQATARPIASGAVVELKLERSGVTASRAPEASDTASVDSPKTNQLTVSTTLVLREGETKIVTSSHHTKGESLREESWVLARVTVAPPEKTPAVSGIRIFHLQNTSAKDTVELIASLFESKPVRAVADVRTNTVIVVSAPEDEMQQIEAILMKLDEGTAALSPTTTRLVPIPENAAPLFNPAPSRKLPTAPPGRDPLDDLGPRSR